MPLYAFQKITSTGPSVDEEDRGFFYNCTRPLEEGVIDDYVLLDRLLVETLIDVPNAVRDTLDISWGKDGRGVVSFDPRRPRRGTVVRPARGDPRFRRPLLELTPQQVTQVDLEQQDLWFWSMWGGVEGQIQIFAAFYPDSQRIAFEVQDIEGQCSDIFEWPLNELPEVIGFEPFGVGDDIAGLDAVPITLTKEEHQEMMIALDYFLETGKRLEPR